MSHQPYPQFSTECALDLYRITTTGAIAKERKLFVKCLYTLEGAAFGIAPGEPDDVLAASAAGEECDVEAAENCLAALEGLNDEGLSADVFGASAQLEGLDPVTLALILQLAQAGAAFIKAWLERRKPK